MIVGVSWEVPTVPVEEVKKFLKHIDKDMKARLFLTQLEKVFIFRYSTFSLVRGAGGPNWPFACLYYFEHSNISVFSKIYLPEIKRLPLATAPRSLAATTLECRNLFPIVRSICWWGLWWWSSWSSRWLLSSGLLSSLLWIGWMVSTHRSQFVSDRSFQLLRRHRMLILWS